MLPTGGGKSLLFMVPACLEMPGVTNVVAPFRVLVDNLVCWLRRAGIGYFKRTLRMDADLGELPGYWCVYAQVSFS